MLNNINIKIQCVHVENLCKTSIHARIMKKEVYGVI